MDHNEDEYHWALLIGPTTETNSSSGRRIHVQERMRLVNGQPKGVWEYANMDTGTIATAAIMARILVARIEDTSRLVSVLERVPVRSSEEKWNCVLWVEEELAMASADGKALGKSRKTEWTTVRDAAMKYIGEKEAAHRYNGKAPKGSYDPMKVATFDLLTGIETIP